MTRSDTSRTIPPEARKSESRGGAVKPQESVSLPDGVLAIAVTHYRVGPFTYSNLDDAMAQHRRMLAAREGSD